MHNENQEVEMNNFLKSEMLLNFAFEMTLKGRPKAAEWARNKSYKYYQLEMKGARN